VGILANLYLKKIKNFGDIGGCRPIFLSHNGEIGHEAADLGLPPPNQIW